MSLRRVSCGTSKFIAIKNDDDNNKHNVAVDSNKQRCRDGDGDVSFFPRLFKLTTMMDDVMIDRICSASKFA